MRTHLVYDLPTRLFHWLFAGLFLTAYLIATFADHKSAAFPIHMLVGAVLCFVVLMRLLWGVVGTRHARFASFALRPHDAFDYFKSIAAGAKGKIWGGHNPASSWARIASRWCAADPPLAKRGTSRNKDAMSYFRPIAQTDAARPAECALPLIDVPA